MSPWMGTLLYFVPASAILFTQHPLGRLLLPPGASYSILPILR